MTDAGLQVVRRFRNGAQYLRDGRLLIDELGHPILRLRSGLFSVDSLVHAEQFLGLDGEGSFPLSVKRRSQPLAIPTPLHHDAARHCLERLVSPRAPAGKREHFNVSMLF
jgi:hypothetical protein